MRRPGLGDALAAIPGPVLPLVRGILAEADARGLNVHLIGGPVRDLLLGRELRDVDLLVEAGAGEGAGELAEAVASGSVRVRRHQRFGTLTIEHEGASVDLATTRRETYDHDGALPRVTPGSLQEDLLRRDFSVNALALPLSKAARAAHTGIVAAGPGLRDLEERRLRTLHRRSFHDDPTRALRAARLAPRLGFSLTRDTRAALRDALRAGAFGRVSGDRLRRELIKLFADATAGLGPARALRLLSDWHVLGALEPGLTLDRRAAAPLRRLGRAVADPPWRPGRWRPWAAGLAVWLAPLAPALRRRALARFSVRGELARRIATFPRARDPWLRAVARARGRGAIDTLLGPLPDEELFALYAWAPPPLRRRVVRYAVEDRPRRAPVNGGDLAALGLSGPTLGRVLAQLRVAYLDGLIRNREEALIQATELGRRRRASSKGRPA